MKQISDKEIMIIVISFLTGLVGSYMLEMADFYFDADTHVIHDVVAHVVLPIVIFCCGLYHLVRTLSRAK